MATEMQTFERFRRNSARMPKPSQIAFLDELRAIAQLGLNYPTDQFNRDRYARLLELACAGYAELARADA